VARSFRTLLLICLAAGGAAPVHAQVVSGSLGATSDFVFRGISLTRGKPAAQASIDVEFPREFYVGAFAATADPNPGPSPKAEIDAWIGRYWRVSEELSADLRLSQYTYPDDPRRFNYNRGELTGTLGFRDSLYLAAVYSPNTKAVGSAPGYKEGDVWAFELSGRRALSPRWSISGGVGHYALDQVYGGSYYYWNATVTAILAPFELQLAYLGVDDVAERHFLEDSTGDRVALTALWRFSTSN
jgi:uncharacterized protein (TIGR02001 family)